QPGAGPAGALHPHRALSPGRLHAAQAARRESRAAAAHPAQRPALRALRRAGPLHRRGQTRAVQARALPVLMKPLLVAVTLTVASALSAEATGGLADGRYNCFVFL